jgi:hypothetical protein
VDSRPAYTGRTKLKFCRRLGANWEELADLAGIRSDERQGFPRGREARAIWDWLDQQGRLDDLPPMLHELGRDDLADLLADDLTDKDIWPPPLRSPAKRLAAAADLLAENTRDYWREQASKRRITTPAPTAVSWEWAHDLAGPPAEVTDPLPAGTGPLPAAAADPGGEAKVLTSGVITQLHDEVYLRLPHRRLVILGAAGAGKTAAVILLLLAALDHRRPLAGQQRAGTPVPVWLTVGGWNPATTSLHEWARETMNRNHPYLRAQELGPDAAGDLLDAGRVALFLDGLDEAPTDARVQVLERLRDEASGLTVVMTSRTDQFRDAWADSRLDNTAVIELRPVCPRAAADYLTHGQAGLQRDRWEQVGAFIQEHPDSVAARVLDNPLTLSLARDTYQHDDPTALIDASSHATEEQLRGRLLARLLDLAYPDQDERDKTTSRLAWIAGHMGTNRDLPWWHIPTWIPAWHTRLTAVLAILLPCAVTIGLTVWLPLALVYGFTGGLGTVYVIGLAIALAFGLLTAASVRPGTEPRKQGRLRLRRPRRRDARDMLKGLLAGGLLFPSLGVVWLDFERGLRLAPALALAGGLLLGLERGLFDRIPVTQLSSTTPLSTYLRERRDGLFYGLSAGSLCVVVGVLLGLEVVLHAGPLAYAFIFLPGSGLALGLMSGLWFGLMSSPFASPLWLTEIALLSQGRGQGRFMPLLEGALDRQVLRQTGAVYQFRHAELQDHLAAMHRQRTAPRTHRHASPSGGHTAAAQHNNGDHSG